MPFLAFRGGSNSNDPSTSGRTAETILQANFRGPDEGEVPRTPTY